MTAAASDQRLTVMGDLTFSICRMLKPAIAVLAAALGGATLYLLVEGSKGAPAFALLSLGTCLALMIWRSRACGVPLLPMLVVQHLVVYGLPIFFNRETLERYPAGLITQAGIELFIFLFTLAVAWGASLRLFNRSSPVSHGLPEYRRGGSKKLRAIAFLLLGISVLYQVLDHAGLLAPVTALLPAGSSSILYDAVAAASTCGMFIGALLIGTREMPAGGRLSYWLLVAASMLMAAEDFILAGAAVYVAAVGIGLFWSSGRMPWRFFVAVGLLAAFLNLGKHAERDLHASPQGVENTSVTLSQLPARYAEWIGVSWDFLTGKTDQFKKRWADELGESEADDAGQSLLERINNLDNLLFVMSAVEIQRVPLLHGATYLLIPRLMIPRVMEPNKPRSHAGQILLNVHFGRQDLESTLETYIAWGLLPEAYGNFGPWFGALILGAVLGFLCAWLENWTASKLVISLEGFVAFIIFAGLANSYEMVASVLVTSIFQAVVPVVLAALPFVQRMVAPRRSSAAVEVAQAGETP